MIFGVGGGAVDTDYYSWERGTRHMLLVCNSHD